jgi:hypothetical protein
VSGPLVDQADQAEEGGRGWLLLGVGMAVVAACVTTFGWIVAGKFEAIFIDLGIRLPQVTAWAVDPRFHALATAPLVAAAAYTVVARSFLPFLLITGGYIAFVVVALFQPLIGITSTLGSSP